VLKNSYFFLNIVHKVKTQRFGESFVKSVHIIYFNMVMIKEYKVKKLTNFWKDWNTPSNFSAEISVLTTLLRMAVSWMYC